MKKKKENDYIYVVLVKSLTILGKVSRLITGYEYTHIAVCLNENLNEFLTFSRKKHYAPFESGFMCETLDCYAFGKNEKIKLKIFKLPVEKNRKKQIEQYINRVANDESYLFNFLSMITMPVIHGFRIYKSHNCMTFVGKVIELTKSVKMNKKYYKYSIKDIDKLLNEYFYIEKYFAKKEITNVDYMKKISIIKNVYSFFYLNMRLIYRIILKRKYLED